MIGRIGLSLVLFTGCVATASVVIKPPVEQRCMSVGLQGCPEVVDGVVAYLNGDKQTAEAKLRSGAAKNTPEQVRAFAELLRDVSSLPGASDYEAPINEVAYLLLGEVTTPPSLQTASPPPTPPSGSLPNEQVPPAKDAAPRDEQATAAAVMALQALSASVDPNRVRTETVALSAVGELSPCDIAGTLGQCSPRRQGPLFVTDMIAQAGCPGRLFVGAVVPNQGSMRFAWYVEAPSPSALTGAKLFVHAGEWLVVAFVPSQKIDSKDPRCSVTWAGFRPKTIVTETFLGPSEADKSTTTD